MAYLVGKVDKPDFVNGGVNRQIVIDLPSKLASVFHIANDFLNKGYELTGCHDDHNLVLPLMALGEKLGMESLCESLIEFMGDYNPYEYDELLHLQKQIPKYNLPNYGDLLVSTIRGRVERIMAAWDAME